jgi:hypothetical protein
MPNQQKFLLLFSKRSAFFLSMRPSTHFGIGFGLARGACGALRMTNMYL